MTARGRKWLVALGALALFASAGGFLAWQRTRPAPQSPGAVPPEISELVVDPQVRAALKRARDKVLAEPRSGQAWGELGLGLRAHGLNAESNACFIEAARLDPENPRWPYLIGTINLLIAPAEALPHLRSAHGLAVEPEHRSLTRVRLAEALFERGDLDGAAGLFAEEARVNPHSPRAHFGMGAVAAARGDHKVAIGSLLLVADSPFTRRKAAALLAASHRQLGNAVEAERFEREASRGTDDLPWPDPFLKEYVYRETGRSARMKAVEELEASGRLAEAVRELDEIARDAPDDQVLVSLAINLAKLGQYARAVELLRKVTARTPDHAVAHYFLGVSLFMPAERQWTSGDQTGARPGLEEAVKELRRAAELKPDKGLANLYAGLALKHLGRLDEAETECRAAVRASPQFADTHLGLGEVLVAVEKPADAIPHLETAARLSPPGDTRARSLLDKISGKKP